MPNALRETDQATLLSGEDQIGWNPNTPVPDGVVVENMRRRGIDQLEITIPHPEARLRTMLRLGVFGKRKQRTATITFAEDHMRVLIPKRFVSQSIETIVLRKDIEAVRICKDHDSFGNSLRISVGGKNLRIGAGLPASTLDWLRERMLLEAAGLVSRPLFNVGRRITRRTSNPDDDFYHSWPSGPNRLISLFLQETPEQVSQLELALDNSDWESAATHCHWLKSSSAAVGAAQLSELCQRMEINIVTGDFSQIESLHVHFGREMEQVTDALTRIVNGEPDNRPVVVPLNAPSPGGSRAAGLNGARILLVEDSLVNQEVACSTLEEAGCVTTVASNGEAAIELYNTESFDLILMDCQMPGVDGFEATRAIRNIESLKLLPRTPIIALTANALKDDRGTCLAAGMNDYLSKPYEEHEIFDMLRKWLPESAPGAEQPQA